MSKKDRIEKRLFKLEEKIRLHKTMLKLTYERIEDISKNIDDILDTLEILAYIIENRIK